MGRYNYSLESLEQLFLTVYNSCPVWTGFAISAGTEFADVMRTLLLLSFLWSLVEVHSQSAPFISLRGETLPDHGYVAFSVVGDSGSDGVQCVTDFQTCCSSSQGDHRGDWYFPNKTRVPIVSGGVVEIRGAQRVELRRRIDALSPSGIYHCEIPTNAVHNDIDITVRETVYVGIYSSGGNSAKRGLTI